VNKKGVRATYPLSTALESTNVEMAKRLKYTKEILTHMLTANQPHQPSGNTEELKGIAVVGDIQRGQGPSGGKGGQSAAPKDTKSDRQI